MEDRHSLVMLERLTQGHSPRLNECIAEAERSRKSVMLSTTKQDFTKRLNRHTYRETGTEAMATVETSFVG